MNGRRVGVVLIAFVLASSDRAAAQRAGLTGAAHLAAIYDAIFDARFEQVTPLLAEACPPGRTGPAPADVCPLMDAVSLWWQIQIDPDDRSRDSLFTSRVDAAIAGIDAWTAREPSRAEAWFYLGGAYGARAQWRVLRGERLAAARDGKRIKEALERSLALDPGLDDAYFGIGLYHYYADVAPAAARMLRWLLFLPGGDRVAGMREMLRARSGGQLLRDEADYQLHLIHLWYEKQPGRAIDLLESLRDRHPRNAHFPQLIADIEDVYLHDTSGSLRSWTALVEAARAKRVWDPSAAEARARLGAALQLDRLFESDAALEHLDAIVQSKPARPLGALARAHVQMGEALDRLGRRSEAAVAYRAAIAALPPGDPHRIGARARTGLRRTPDADTARAYRLSLEGWRALERGALADAASLLTESLALRPDDQVTRYRRARLLQAQKNEAAALEALESIVLARAAAPPTFYAAACVDAARLHEQHGAPGRAIELYRAARDVFGADRRTKEIADRALARLEATKTP